MSIYFSTDIKAAIDIYTVRLIKMSNENKKGRKAKETDYNNIFAVRLRELIKATGKKQQEIADNIGVSRQALNKWVNGETVPDIFSAAKIADLFDVSTDYLMGRTDVLSMNEDIQTVCKVTGLDEYAVKELIHIKKIRLSSVTNYLICEENFKSIVCCMDSIKKQLEFIVEEYGTKALCYNMGYINTSDYYKKLENGEEADFFDEVTSKYKCDFIDWNLINGFENEIKERFSNILYSYEREWKNTFELVYGNIEKEREQNAHNNKEG